MRLSLCSLFRSAVVVGGLAIAILASAQTDAAPAPTVPDRLKPMQVRIVDDARPGCAPNCLEWIAAEGKIVPDTRIAFARVLRSLGSRHLPIFIDSGGGLVNEAMAIGRMIRARHLDVVVTQTLSDTCAGAACLQHLATEPARTQVIGSICASACTLILAGGSRRFAALGTHVGVHQMIGNGTRIWKQKIFRDLTRTVDGVKILINRTTLAERVVRTDHFTSAAPKAVYNRVESYLADMGIKPAIMPLMLSAAPSSMHWLSHEEMQSTAFVTDEGAYSTGPGMLAAPDREREAVHLAMSAPEEAMLVSPAGDAPRQKITLGHVTWTLDHPPGALATDDRLVLGARVEIPQAQTRLDLRIAPDTNASGTLRIDMTFWTPNGSLRKIMRVWPLQARSETPLQVTSLEGAVSSSMTGTFAMTAGRDTAGMPVTALLISRRSLVVPVLTEELQAVDIRFEHGISATPLLARAFASWTRGAKLATAPVGAAEGAGSKP